MYEDLAVAIIKQACKDYILAVHDYELDDIEKFFRSDWCTNLSSLDGTFLLRECKRIRKEFIHEVDITNDKSRIKELYKRFNNSGE